MAEPLGALQRQKLLDGGMAPSDVAVWQADQEQKLLAGGMNAGDISLYFGQPNPDTAAIDKKIQPSLAIPGAKVATNMWENFLAGIQGSTIVPMAKAAWATNPFVLTSNAGRDFAKGRMPDPVGDIQEALDPANSAPTLVAPAENDFMGTVAHGAGMTLGDAPLWLSTFLSTTAAAVETGPAAPFIGAGAASALTSTARNVYVDAWTHPNDGLVGSKDWQARAAGISLNVGVETTIGVASMGAGMLASKVAAPILAPVVGETGAKVGGFVAGAGAPIPFIANTNSLMERGELAGPQEYAEATAMLIGGMALGPVMHITGHLGKPSPKVSADNMSRDGQQMYDTLTGVFVDKNLTPDEVSMAAANDPVVRQEILAPFDEHGNWATPELDRLSTLSGRADPAETPLKVEPPPKVEGEEPIAPAPPHLKAEDVPPVHLDIFRSLEGAEDGLVNLDGRIGAFQLNATEAAAHGFEGANLVDPVVNEKVASAIVADLTNKFNGNMEDMVVGWVGGESAARLWISQGRDFNQLPRNIQRKLIQAEANGAFDTVVEAVAPFSTETRGAGVQYHGSGNPNLVVDSNFYTTKNYYGQGFYTTDAQSIGYGYSRKGAATPEDRTVYRVDENRPLNIYDAESPIAEVEARIRDRIGDTPGEVDGFVIDALDGVYGDKPKNLRELYDTVRDESAGEGLSADTVQEAFEGLNEILREQGYDGLSHTGGLRTKNEPHKVVIYFDPEKDITLSKAPSGAREASTTRSDKYQNIDLENQYTGRGGSVDWIPPASGGGGGKKPPLSGEVIPPAPGPKKIEGTVPREPTLDEHMDNVLDFIGPDDRPGLLDTLKNTWVGFTHALDTIQSEPRRQDRRLGVGKNEFGIEDLKRTTFSSRDRVGLFNNKGAVRLSFKGVEPVWEVDLSVPSIEAAIGLVKKNKGNMRDFLAYWMSAHALELEMAGTRSGLTPEQIASARAVQGDKGMVAKYEGPLQAFQANKNAALEYVHAAGFWNDKTWPVIRGQFTAHLYWGRYFDKLATQSGLNGRSLKPGQPTKEQKGSGRLLNSNPLVNDSIARALMIVAADRNLAMRGIVDVINGKDPIPGFNTVKDGTATSKLVKDMETGEYLPADLMGPDGKPIPEGELNLAKPLLVEQYINAKYADRFVVWRNGEPEVWQASSPEMLEVMRLAGPGSKDLVSKVFHGITQWARRGIVGAPFFGLKTLTYGELTKWAQGGAMPYIGLMDGIFASINPKFKGAWDQARANGTFADFTEDLNSRYGWLDVESVFQTTGTARRVFNTVAAPFTAPGKVLRAVNQYLHNASAFGNMRYLERKGLSPTKAAQQTRVHMLDPAEASVQPALEWIARSVNFLRSAQLEAQAINRSLNPTIPGNFTNAMTNLAKMAVAMTIPSMMQVASQLALDRNRKDEDKYYNQPRWARDRYWRIGDMQWPAPPSMLTTVFKVLPERMMEYMLTQNPHSFDELWGNLASNMAPTLIPTLPAPAIESWANKDFMFNTPIVSRGMQGLAGEMQYNANSTETAKAIARAVGSQNPFGSWNWSPMHIDNWAREWGGTMPVQILKIVEGPFKPVRKSTDAADIPFLGAFFVRKYGAGQQLDDFYDAYTKYSTAHQSYNEALDRNNPAEIAAFASSDYAKATKVDIGGGVMVSIQGAYVAINQALAVIRAIDMLPNPDGTTPSGAADLMDAISNKDKFGLTTVEERPLNARRPAMTPDEKRLAIDTIASQIYVTSKALTLALDKAASAK